VPQPVAQRLGFAADQPAVEREQLAVPHFDHNAIWLEL